MSWEATQWANKQRLRLPQEQLVLLCVANCADPEGVAFTWWKRKEHWWTYLVDHTRLSRATIFRHLNTIEGLGLGRRQKIVAVDGTVRFVMELDLEKFVDMEAADVDEPQHLDSQSHSETGTICNQSHGETVPVSLVRLQEKNLSESPDSLPDPSQAPSGLSKEDSTPAIRNPHAFEQFKSLCGGPPSAYPQLLIEEWNRLTPEKEAQLLHGAAGLGALRARNARGLVGPLKLIRNSILWSDYGRHAPQPSLSAPPRAWHALGSVEWRGRAALYAIIGREMPEAKPNERGEKGADFLGSLPQAGLVLAQFADNLGQVRKCDWVFLHAPDDRFGDDMAIAVDRDRPKIAAWRERVHECLGIAVAATVTKLPFPVAIRQPGTNATIETNYGKGLWVPTEWPPAKGSTDPPNPTTSDDDEFMKQQGLG